MEKIDILNYFENTIDYYENYTKRNRYFHKSIQSFIKSNIPENSDVLEIGTLNGDILSCLKPKRGIGLCVNETLRQKTLLRCPDLEFVNMDIDKIECPAGFEPDYIFAVNTMDFVYDLWDFFKSLKKTISRETTIIITATNPVWKPLLKIASILKIRTPYLPGNYVTNQDIISVMRLQGYDIVKEGTMLFLPVYIPVISKFLNVFMAEIPYLKRLCSTQFIIAKIPKKQNIFSCSVIIPCHNEEDNIAECIRRVPNMGSKTEIVVVDDGSTDNTAQKVIDAQKSDKRIKLISYKPNAGKSNAVKKGFQTASGDVLMILDADMTVMPEDLSKFIEPIESGHADFVNGTRLIYPLAKGSMKFMNYLGNKFFCFLISWIIGQRVSDTLCGTKVLFKKDFLKIKMGEEKWGDFDLIFGAAEHNLRIFEIPVHYKERVHGVSKMNAFKEVFIFTKVCIRKFIEFKMKKYL